MAGSFVGILTNPLIVVRTRMQAEIFNNPCDFHYSKKYGYGPVSIFKVMNNIV